MPFGYYHRTVAPPSAIGSACLVRLTSTAPSESGSDRQGAETKPCTVLVSARGSFLDEREVDLEGNLRPIAAPKQVFATVHQVAAIGKENTLVVVTGGSRAEVLVRNHSLYKKTKTKIDLLSP